MMFKKRSFFERLTGVVDDDTPLPPPLSAREMRDPSMRSNLPSRDFGREQMPASEERGARGDYNYPSFPAQRPVHVPIVEEPAESEDAEGQLAVDVYQTRTEVIIQTMVAGVRPDDLNISITHEKVTIAGRREGPHGIPPEDYFHSELYWGNFSRTIHLPQEVEPEAAEAIEKHGLLILRLPKVDKERQHKIKIKQL